MPAFATYSVPNITTTQEVIPADPSFIRLSQHFFVCNVSLGEVTVDVVMGTVNISKGIAIPVGQTLEIPTGENGFTIPFNVAVTVTSVGGTVDVSASTVTRAA